LDITYLYQRWGLYSSRQTFSVVTHLSNTQPPSDEKNSKLKALFWMVITGNSVLIIVHSLIYCLYHFDMYNPWIYNCEENMLIIKEEVFKNINPLMISLFVGATVPVLLSRCLPSQRWLYICKLRPCIPNFKLNIWVGFQVGTSFSRFPFLFKTEP